MYISASDNMIPPKSSMVSSSLTTIIVDKQPRYAAISLLSTPQIASSPFLPLFRPMMNAAFGASHRTGPIECFPPSVMRLRTDDQYLVELGLDAFTYVLSSPLDDPNDLRLYASASAKPFTGKAAEGADSVVNTFKRVAPLEPLDPNVEQWELILMAVDVSLQRQGIAGKLIDMVEEEIRRRTKGNGKEVHVILSTLKEVNFEYYLRKGYTWTAEKRFEPGVHSSRDGFTVVEMMKRL